MIYLGIDLHTRNMTICAVSSNGTKIGEWKLSNCEDQLDKLINQFEQPIKAVVEATSRLDPGGLLNTPNDPALKRRRDYVFFKIAEFFKSP